MPCTALRVHDPEKGAVHVKFMTNMVEAPATEGDSTKLFLNIEVYLCDENFIPQGTTSKTIMDRDEEDYHRDLRKQAHEKGHFVPEESTDPEWNPNYVKPEEDNNEFQCDMPK